MEPPTYTEVSPYLTEDVPSAETISVKKPQNLQLADFLMSIVILLIVTLLFGLVAGIFFETTKPILPKFLIALVIFAGSYYPLYYVLNRTYHLCQKKHV